MPRRNKCINKLPSFDDTLRVAVARELVRIGVPSASLHSLFKSIETPAKGVVGSRAWDWLRSQEARVDGAALVLILQPASVAPSNATGFVYLTTARQAVEHLKPEARKPGTAIVIDVGALILQLEERTGATYR